MTHGVGVLSFPDIPFMIFGIIREVHNTWTNASHDMMFIGPDIIVVTEESKNQLDAT